MATSRAYPRRFFIAAFVLVAIGAVGLSAYDRPATRLSAFIPSLLLTTVLLSAASGVLLTAIFNRTRERSLAVLALVFIALSGIELGVLLTVPLPGSDVPLIDAGDNVAPYLTLLALLIMPCGAIWYAIESRMSIVLAPDRARRLYVAGMPAAIAGTVAAIALIAFASRYLPPLVHGDVRPGFQRSPFSYLQVGANLFAVGFLLRFATPQQRRGLNLAIQLAIIASASASIVVLTGHYRFGLAAIIGRSLIVLSATFVLVAAMRNLVERLADGLRIEADALRTQAVVFERNAAVEVSLVKSRFVAMVSHELRTPLTGIIGMAELLQRSALDDRQRSWTRAIRSSADTLLRVVNDLLDFSRAESGKVELEEIPFDVPQAVEDVVVLFREQARVRGVQMLSYIDPAVPRTIAGDQMRVQQVLQNLLNNAVRFTECGSIRVDVTLEHGERGQLVRWDVHDTGIGIAPGAQERIFQAFTQEDASTARRFGGTGLGLSIARHLVELMGGHLTVRSTPGQGSTFTFTIPYQPVARPGAVDSLLRDTRVLIVESDDDVRPMLQRYVRGWEMRCTAIAGPAELDGVERETQRGYDVLLLGPGLAESEALLVAESKSGHPSIAQADTILIRDIEADDGLRERFDARVVGPLRQSTLYDTIVRLRRNGIVERLPQPVQGSAERTRRAERILIAEDNEVNQELLVAQLAHLGFGADVVGDGDAAVAAVERGSYALVFMDAQMPGVDGFEAARRIRARGGRCSTMPIVALTANVLPGYREACLAAGMDDFLAKPALIAPLAAIVDRWLPVAGRSARRRLLEIFKNDAARVDALIARSLDELTAAAIELRGLLDARDAAAARLAHKVTGIALEIGLDAIAAATRELEASVIAHDWTRADEHHTAFVEALEGSVAVPDRAGAS